MVAGTNFSEKLIISNYCIFYHVKDPETQAGRGFAGTPGVCFIKPKAPTAPPEADIDYTRVYRRFYSRNSSIRKPLLAYLNQPLPKP